MMSKIGFVRLALALTFVSIAACSSSSGGGGSSDDGNSSTGSGKTGGGKVPFGADCKEAVDCETGVCVTGSWGGFCSRQCSNAADCPEMGWECNITPYTACVPNH
jgi:hypothetical protein